MFSNHSIRVLFIFFLTLSFSTVSAQNADNSVTTPESPWKVNWVGSVNGSQAQYSNWSKGGANSIAVTGSTVFNANYKKDKIGYRSEINIKYGQTRIENQDVQKTDDLIRINNKADYFFSSEIWSAFAEIDFKTQFDRGLNAEGEMISNFFAPAFFQEALGLSYKQNAHFSAEAGLALKQTMVSDTSLSQFYGVTAGEKFRNEGGLSIALRYSNSIMENTTYTGSIETFTNVKTHLINRTDVIFSNELNGKINDYLNANLQFVLMYDRDFSNKVQLKQVLALGLSITFL